MDIEESVLITYHISTPGVEMVYLDKVHKKLKKTYISDII